MNENEARRLARRQTRGRRRTESILQAAGEIFVEYGYDRATTELIAQRANVSAGSLYQFFPNKEAIAQAFATQAVEQLQQLYDETILVPEVMELPFDRFLNYSIDILLTFNRNHPGYFALLQGATISPQLAGALQDQRQGLLARMRRAIEVLAPHCSPKQGEVLTTVTYRVFLALLPLILQTEEPQRSVFIRELKAILFRYFEPMQHNGQCA
jgi:AcrR family transcriptional regulator